jgi:hypothetical protein
MQDSRKHPREHLEEYCLLIDAESNVPIGEILDISREGMRIFAGSPIAETTCMQCKLRLPRSVDGRNEIVLNAWCVWCEKGADNVSYQAGLRIAGISAADADILEKFLRTAVSEATAANNR